MAREDEDKSFNLVGIILLAAIVIIAGATAIRMLKNRPPEQPPAVAAPPAHVPVQKQSVLDYSKLEKDESLKTLMTRRKVAYGLGKALDLIVKSDEILKIGPVSVSMQEILEKIRLQKGDFIEKDIWKDSEPGAETYGIYVVQPGDNIWNIHFRFIRNYMQHKGVTVSLLADEPSARGISSGVGKLLKFSENMVFIYDINEKRLNAGLDRIQPQSKLIVYNMQRVFALLDQIDYAQVDRIAFDGETIWVPAQP